MKQAVARYLGRKNVYSRIGYLNEDRETEVDKVFVDLDPPQKPSNGKEKGKVLDRIRGGELDLAEEVYGPIIEDARKLAHYLMERDIPTVGVFSGLGLHIHALFKPKVEPSQEIKSTGLRMVDEADVNHADEQIFGDTHRLCRIANCPRVEPDMDSTTYTVPLEHDELLDLSARDLVRMSESQRSIGKPDGERRELKVHDDYLKRADSEAIQLPLGEVEVNSDYAIDVLEEFIPLPCIRKRLMTREPGQAVRFQGAVMLFNQGFTPDDVHDIFARLNWADYDPEITQNQLEHIWNKGYSEMSCSTLDKDKGLCVMDDRHECPTYGWKGGDLNY